MAKLKSSKKQQIRKSVETLMHDEASRKNIPTAEYQSVLQKEEQRPVRVTLPRNATRLETEKCMRICSVEWCRSTGTNSVSIFGRHRWAINGFSEGNSQSSSEEFADERSGF
jgi:hypothetical protein